MAERMIVSGNAVDLEVERLTGIPGLGHLSLQVTVRVTIPSGPTGRMECVPASARIMAGRRAPRLLAVAPVVGSPSLLLGENSTTDIVRFEASLGGTVLEALEEARGNNDLDLEIYIPWSFRGGTVDTQVCTIRHTVPQSEWIKILNVADGPRRVLIEVPILENVGPAAAEHLRISQMDLHRGEPRKCIAECREVLDALAKDRPDIQNWTPPTARKQEWEKSDRVRALFWGLHHLVGAAHHATEDRKFSWDRAEAVAALSMTASVIRLLEEE